MMTRRRKPIAARLDINRSRVSNNSLLLVGIDGRSAAARRYRDLVVAFEREFKCATESERTLIRNAALMTVKLEEMAAATIRGEHVDIGDMTRTIGSQRRILNTLEKRTDADAPAILSLAEHLAAGQEIFVDEDAADDAAEDAALDARLDAAQGGGR
jgi:hypothetical protein